MALVRVTSKGQATLPKDMREKVGIRAPGRVAVIEDDGVLVIVPVLSVSEFRRRYRHTFRGEALRDLRVEMAASEEMGHRVTRRRRRAGKRRR